jgi:hypothetical protein
MIEVRYLGRLANNLFQYSIGRIIAENAGLQLRADPICDFPETRQMITGRSYEEQYDFYADHIIPLNELSSSKRNRGIVLRGYFQRQEYYLPHRTRIASWLTFSRSALSIPSRAATTIKSSIVINVRRCDYLQLGWALPFSYYEEAIEKLRSKKVEPIWVVTDDPNDPFFRKFKKYRPQFFHGTPTQQLYFLSLAPKLVMSQSTFSWWANFLASEQVAVCPAPAYGCWSGHPPFEDINLIDHERFTVIKVEEQYLPSNTEIFYQKTKNLWSCLKRRLEPRIKM